MEERRAWKCPGRIEKYDRPCPQKFGFFAATATEGEILAAKSALQIKCPRCGFIDGGQ